MTQMMNILEDYCYYKKYKYCRLDGSMKIEDRSDQVRFWITTCILYDTYCPHHMSSHIKGDLFSVVKMTIKFIKFYLNPIVGGLGLAGNALEAQ